MRQVVVRFEPNGLAEVVEGFLQPCLLLRGQVEAFRAGVHAGRVEGVPVISDRLVQGLNGKGQGVSRLHG